MKLLKYRLKRNNRRVAINPNLISAVYEKSKNITEIYTLDCAKDEDAWDIKEEFDKVIKHLEGGVTKLWKKKN